MTKVATKAEPETVGELVDNLPAPSAAAPVPMENTIFQIIERASRDPNVDIDKMERLILMQERVQARQAEIEFDNAMSGAQEDMKAVQTDSLNKQTGSKYASYAALDAAIRPIYAAHGFSLSFDTADGAPPDSVRVVCKVAHRGGHRERPRVDMPCDGKGAKGGDVMTRTHAMGSAVSYGKRYLLGMIFNLATTKDDDGNAAGAKGMSGGGTDFRPERRANVPANFVEASRQDGTLDETRKKGDMPGAKAKPNAAAKTKTFIDNAVQTVKLSAHTVESISVFQKENTKQLDWIKENFPTEYDRFAIARDDAYEAARARVPS